MVPVRRAAIPVVAAILAFSGPIRAGLVCASLICAGSAPAQAADLGLYGTAPVVEGVPCDSPQALAFPTVWLGHFAGGVSSYPGPGQSIALDWRDQKLCFQTHRACGAYIAEMRRAFHRPEGYFTCLPIR